MVWSFLTIIPISLFLSLPVSANIKLFTSWQTTSLPSTVKRTFFFFCFENKNYNSTKGKWNNLPTSAGGELQWSLRLHFLGVLKDSLKGLIFIFNWQAIFVEPHFQFKNPLFVKQERLLWSAWELLHLTEALMCLQLHFLTILFTHKMNFVHSFLFSWINVPSMALRTPPLLKVTILSWS